MSSISKSLYVIVLFLIYTFLIPTTGINVYVKIALDILFLGFILYFYRKDLKENLINFKNDFKSNIKYILLFWLLILLSNGLINGVIEHIFDIYAPNNDAQLELINSMPIYLGFSMLIFSPIVEELSIRKGFKDVLKNDKLYVILSSFIYSLLYVIFTCSGITYIFIISYFVAAVIYAVSYLKSKNILVPMFIHLLQNIFVFIIYIVTKGV